MEEEYGGREEWKGQNTEQTEFELNMDILDEQTGTSTTLIRRQAENSSGPAAA